VRDAAGCLDIHAYPVINAVMMMPRDSALKRISRAEGSMATAASKASDDSSPES
jgi:hypothetical protein